MLSANDRSQSSHSYNVARAGTLQRQWTIERSKTRLTGLGYFAQRLLRRLFLVSTSHVKCWIAIFAFEVVNWRVEMLVEGIIHRTQPIRTPFWLRVRSLIGNLVEEFLKAST